MLGSKIDLFRKEWLDVVFVNKNKNYGAYDLRSQNASNTTRALLFTSSVFLGLFFAPYIYNKVKGLLPEPPKEVQKEITMLPPPPVDDKKPLPPPVEPPPPKEDQVKFPPPIVKPDDQVRDEEPPKVADLQKADPGQKTVEGNPDADIVVVEAVGEGPKQAVVVEDNKVYDYVSLEAQPGYPGGMSKFYEYVGKSVRYPPMAQESGLQGKVFVSFVIEKDGSLTDVRVERKIGGGLDEEAIRVLKGSKRWQPGMQNGSPVRVKYNIPINFTLAEQ
ncbi:MAG: TonB family protein [Sphingobacteriaceae bacterium]|nr:TonB family protein [Sphingobacteriaceae bacterium]